MELFKRNFIKKTKHRTPKPQYSNIPKYSEFKTNTKNSGKVKINKYWEIRNKSGSKTSDAIRT